MDLLENCISNSSHSIITNIHVHTSSALYQLSCYFILFSYELIWFLLIVLDLLSVLVRYRFDIWSYIVGWLTLVDEYRETVKSKFKQKVKRHPQNDYLLPSVETKKNNNSWIQWILHWLFRLIALVLCTPSMDQRKNRTCFTICQQLDIKRRRTQMNNRKKRDLQRMKCEFQRRCKKHTHTHTHARNSSTHTHYNTFIRISNKMWCQIFLCISSLLLLLLLHNYCCYYLFLIRGTI